MISSPQLLFALTALSAFNAARLTHGLFLFCFDSCIYNSLHGASRAMAAAVPLPLAEQRRAFLVNFYPTSDQLAQL